MNDPVVLQLSKVVTAHGEALLRNPAQLEELLSGFAASFPGKVKALLVLLDKKAVAFLTNWSKDPRPDKGSYEQVREQVASKFEQAKLLNAAAAAWGLDAWAAALGLRPAAGAAAAPAAEPKPTSGLSLAEPDPVPAPIKPAVPVVAAGLAAATVVQAKAAGGGTANPYAPPAAPVSDPTQETDESAFIPGGRSVAAGRGWSWVAEGWDLFKQSPMIWIVNFLVFMFILIFVQLVPIIGGLAGMLLAPVLGAGIVIGARAVHQGEALEVAHLFAGFHEHKSPLMMIGVLNMLATVAIVIVVFAVLAMVGAHPQSFHAPPHLIIAGLSIPLMMAFWWAPALVALNGFTALEAMKTSFFACLKNIMPILVYVVVGMLLAVAATIPVMLGWFIFVPVWMASMYTSYRDIFYDE